MDELAMTFAQVPCNFILHTMHGPDNTLAHQRCIALAVPGSQFCVVHQPYIEQARRREHERREKREA